MTDRTTKAAMHHADRAEFALAQAKTAYEANDSWVLADLAKQASRHAANAEKAATRFEEREGRGREEPEASRHMRRAAKAAGEAWILVSLEGAE